MAIANYPSIRSYSTARNRDGWIPLGYAAFAIVAIAAIYFAAGGPEATAADIVSAAVLP